jgi:hypothetical protein
VLDQLQRRAVEIRIRQLYAKIRALPQPARAFDSLYIYYAAGSATLFFAANRRRSGTNIGNVQTATSQTAPTKDSVIATLSLGLMGVGPEAAEIGRGISLTTHAVEQMTERNVTGAMIEDAVNNGQMFHDNLKLIRLRGESGLGHQAA